MAATLLHGADRAGLIHISVIALVASAGAALWPARALDPSGLGGTYSGPPIACAAALAVLEVIDGEKLLDRANAIGEKLRAKLAEFSRRNDLLPIANVRGPGAMTAFDIVKSRGTSDPDGDAAKRVTAKALENGLILLSCGIYGETIRILVPLTASDAILDEGLAALEAALKV